MEEDSIEIVVVILPGVSQKHVKVDPTLSDHRREAYDLGACTYNYKQLELPIILEASV